MNGPRYPGVGCGVAVVAAGRILLVRRLRDPEAGCWALPGGKVDWLEPVEATIRRETEEEVGIALTGPLDLLGVVDLIEPDAHWVSPIYLATAFKGEPRLMEPEKHAAVGWFHLDAPPEPVTVSVAAALEALRDRPL